MKKTVILSQKKEIFIRFQQYCNLTEYSTDSLKEYPDIFEETEFLDGLEIVFHFCRKDIFNIDFVSIFCFFEKGSLILIFNARDRSDPCRHQQSSHHLIRISVDIFNDLARGVYSELPYRMSRLRVGLYDLSLEYEAFIAQQKKLKAEREAAEAAKVETAEPEVDVAEEPVDVATEEPVDEVTEEPADEVVEEGEVTAESTEEVEPVQKKTSRKKKADAE